MFSKETADETFAANCSYQLQDPSLYCLGWSLNDSACSLFSSLAADSMFYNHFRASGLDNSEVHSTSDGRIVSQFSSHNADVSAYVQSKILPSTCVEHTNIMYWADRFHLCESERDAREYDEAKRSEGRALIWPYVRSSFSDVNEFCSFISLYIFQVCFDQCF